MQTLQEIIAAEKQAIAARKLLVENYNNQPKVKPLVEYRLVFDDASPLFSLQSRCLNREELKNQQSQDFEFTGSSWICLDNYSENWRHQMRYVLSEHNGNTFLVYLGGGTIHTRTDKACFGYTLLLSKEETKAIKAQQLPKTILSKKDWCEIA